MSPAGARRAPTAPTLRLERSLLRAGHHLVAGVDEVGRGALAGPVTVGVLVVGPGTPTAPQGLRDSKLLTPSARDDLAPRLRGWAQAWAVGHAEPAEVDALGITAALRLAGRRALAQLPVAPSVVVLDGAHDWLSDPAGDALPGLAGPEQPCAAPPVTTRVKADTTCASVAGASVLAKTARDALMAERHAAHPCYDWAANKGYGAPGHLAAIAAHGRCPQHRLSWRLPAAALPTGVLPAPRGADDARGTRRA
ncbi:ribonuclease HII [Paenibacillus sp. TRM 82003]|uniref:ribonuclease HII n=1 Tax=Kineococcus sp. TRM81007 TaxID=2925831 RepID=UPI001F570033|nr:ribonuclease HII [Kineococcus sp. TRM81007]MCI2240231.1 ribonuclease HII [Kineococcus sp. TRM81007]MCI3927591.1 ribonuclease HII [Paenibacillus sp. TRM 82003]